MEGEPTNPSERRRQFLSECALSEERLLELGDRASALEDIYFDFISRSAQLGAVADGLVRLLQRLPHVHSVRWRVKDASHLVSKIVRKLADGVDKYDQINAENYLDIVTDLIGVRVLHLFKGDFAKLHESVVSTWELSERPVAYVRAGDSDGLRLLYRELGLDVAQHSDGYRSIHYILKTNFTKQAVNCELQVRTIFEEGWSEIDHTLRYPDFSNDSLVQEFLQLFNRISGAADEMGTFVKRFTAEQRRIHHDREEAMRGSDQASRDLSEKMSLLEGFASANSELKEEIASLRDLVERRDQAILRKYGEDKRRATIFGNLGVPDDLVSDSKEAALRLGITENEYERATNVGPRIVFAPSGKEPGKVNWKRLAEEVKRK